MKKLVLGKRILALGAIFAVGYASADPMILDRGLPTANLNNPAGTERSNVTWGYPDYPQGDYLIGDTFNLNSSDSYAIDDFTVWFTNGGVNATNTAFSLYIGSTASPTLTNVFTAATTSLATYSSMDVNGYSSYETSTSGTYRDITQLTFTNLGLRVSGNTDYYFTVVAEGNGNGLIQPFFLHSSNAARSGSTQEDADDLISAFLYNAGTVQWAGDFTTQGNGWDKASDVNVQITGSVVPVPAAAWMGFLGIGMIAARRRLKKA